MQFALDISASSLDIDAAQQRHDEAVSLGVTPDQLSEVVTLLASIGVHTFFEGARMIDLASPGSAERGAFDPERQEIWDRHVGDRRYWIPMKEEIPGFLEALLWTSPDSFTAFITFVGVPFKSRHVDTLSKELISMAADASVSHRYLPGMRMHLRTSVLMGANRTMILEALAIGAASSSHIGVH
ncbi:hypothetical protein [Leifsonia kafniensis]